MSASANLLLQAIRTALGGDVALTALTGPEVLHDRLLDRPRFPAIVVAEMKSDDMSTDAEVSEEHHLTLEVWSDRGRKQAIDIAARIRAGLHDAALTLPAVTLVSLLHLSTRTRREAKTRNHIAEMRFRAVTE